MSDRRLTPANTRVAAEHLRGLVEAARYAVGTPRMVVKGVVDLWREPGGARDRQLLMGAGVTVFEDHDGWSFVQAVADGYVGYVPEQAIGPVVEVTHRVDVRATHAYSAPDLKSPELLTLSYGARLAVLPAPLGGDADRAARFVETTLGFVPRRHLVPVSDLALDPVAEAEKLLGTPYLWGGNSTFGIDCSGLVQGALAACGQACSADSDLQEQTLGRTLPPGAQPRRGDVLFWKGHVGWVAGPDLLLHANAYSMSVAYEPLADAVARIENQGDGPVTRHARLTEEVTT
ncbi:C40 family peptidase [Puniceibacterium sediminis]|uniref:Cell wall-associated hydrolase, NlpC family n=1 Tax=Puniceibacterium sediminis TaxID=1608407 RepID=A0A238VI39_9RHOB|nr:NlpC/P60 family protein [Puniceibacterium sediminis]SNR33159.1 Cell wall-associated hydrolase, NlpC family [Puniceibacterium sediminis]